MAVHGYTAGLLQDKVIIIIIHEYMNTLCHVILDFTLQTALHPCFQRNFALQVVCDVKSKTDPHHRRVSKLQSSFDNFARLVRKAES